MEKTTFVVACKKYFGLHEGQTLAQFQQEIKTLTPEDKAELCRLFPSVGYDIIPSPGLN